MKKALALFAAGILTVACLGFVVEQATSIYIRNSDNEVKLKIVSGTNQTQAYITAGTQTTEYFSVNSTGQVYAAGGFVGNGAGITNVAQTPIRQDVNYAGYSATNLGNLRVTNAYVSALDVTNNATVGGNLTVTGTVTAGGDQYAGREYLRCRYQGVTLRRNRAFGA